MQESSLWINTFTTREEVGKFTLWEVAVVYAAMAIYLAGLALLIAKRVKPARYLLSIGLIPSLALLLDYVYAFLTNNFSLEDVYKSSSSGLPQLYKLTASWTTAGGSILLLVVMMGVGLLIHELKALSTRDEGRVTSMVVSFLIFYFLVAVVMVGPFTQLGSSPSNGLGLTPSLQSYWAAIHPPTVLGAYVVVLFAYCSVLSNRSSNKGSRLGDGRLLTGAWVLLGAGIALGGVWAYQTLGWGGYWSWDPIETSALIPWLALSAVLFARRLGSGNLELFGMTLATSTLLLISYVARGSSVESLHSYGDLATGLPFIVLALFPVIFSLGAAFKSRSSPVLRTAPVKGEFYLLEFWCLVLLSVANLVLLLLEVFASDFGVMFATSPALHNYVSFLFVLALSTLLSVEGGMERPSMKYVVILGPILLAVGAGLWFANVLTASPYLAVGLPFLLALSAGAGIGVAGTLSSLPKRAPTASTVRYLTVLGLGIMLIGVFVSASTRTTFSGEMGVGDSVTVGGTTLTVISITTTPGAGTVDMPGHGIVRDDRHAGDLLHKRADGGIPHPSQVLPRSRRVLLHSVHLLLLDSGRICGGQPFGECRPSDQPGLRERRFGKPHPRRNHGPNHTGHLARLGWGGTHPPGEPLLCSQKRAVPRP